MNTDYCDYVYTSWSECMAVQQLSYLIIPLILVGIALIFFAIGSYFNDHP